jgi:hypothetical protein
VANSWASSVYFQWKFSTVEEGFHPQRLGGNMCEIGKPLEIIDVQPLNLPPLRREKETPVEQPAPVEVPVTQGTPEGAIVSPVASTEGTAFPLF